MTKQENGNGLHKIIIAVLTFVILVIGAAWAIDDRMERKIENVKNEFRNDSKCIREMQTAIARIEEQLKNIQRSLDDKK